MEGHLSKNEDGQGVVEYILLLMVVVVLASSVIRSEFFVDLLGEDSEFFLKLKKQQEYSFRHGNPHPNPSAILSEEDSSNYTADHHTYKNPLSGQSRFFTNTVPYPGGP